jgi:hypothetical protein
MYPKPMQLAIEIICLLAALDNSIFLEFANLLAKLSIQKSWILVGCSSSARPNEGALRALYPVFTRTSTRAFYRNGVLAGFARLTFGCSVLHALFGDETAKL